MKKFMLLFIIGILTAAPFVAALETNKAGGVKPDSFLYFLDVGLDNLFVNFGIKDAISVAEERLAELKESTLLEDAESSERARIQLESFKGEIIDEDLIEAIDQEEENIIETFSFTEQELIDAVNNYSKIEELTEEISFFGVETAGLIEKKWYVTVKDGKIGDLQEAETLEDVEVLTLDYSMAIRAIQDTDYREKQLDRLLKYKQLAEDAQSLMEREGIEEGNDQDGEETSGYEY